MTIGVGLFGTITAFLANVFMGPGDDEEAKKGTADGLAGLAGQIEELKSMLQEYQKTNSDLKAKVESLELILKKQNS
jgi:hypothetical protein